MGFFHAYLSEPIYNLLVFIYTTFPFEDIGIAIIILTLVIKLVLWPLTGKSLKGQRALQSLQPKIEELKKKYADNKEEMAKQMMALYKTEKVSPASSCLPMLVQLPILIALYRVLLVGLKGGGDFTLYGFVTDPGTINHMMFGVINLASPNIPIAVLAGIFQYFQAKQLSHRRPPPALRQKEGAKDEDMMAAMNKSMMYFMPVITVVIGATLPGGLALYWLVITILSLLQQHLIFKKLHEEESVTNASS